jgi:hypothetical protein
MGVHPVFEIEKSPDRIVIEMQDRNAQVGISQECDELADSRIR